MSKVFVFILKFYQKYISIMLPNSCKFQPSCSEYAIQSLKKLSLPYAIFKIIYRILKCNPFHKGGYDPIDK